MEYGQIQDEVEFWVLDLPTGIQSRIPEFINAAIREAEDRHNFRCMENELLPITVDRQRELTTIDRAAVDGSGWKENRGKPYLFHQTGATTEIDWASSESDMIRSFAIQLPDEGNTAAPDEGRPIYLLENESNIEVFPLPDNESDWDNGLWRVVVPYWCFLADLTGDNDTNWFTTNAHYYCIWKATSLAFAANRDEERAEYYSRKAEAKFQIARRQDKMSRLSDRITLSARKDVYTGRARAAYREG